MVLISLLAAGAIATSVGSAAEQSPDFASYAAHPSKPNSYAPLHLAGNGLTHRFQSALEDAYDADVDFAGRYVLAEIGCGAGCIRIAALDTHTGAVRWFSSTVSGWSKITPDPLEYRTDSRLLIVHGQLDERGDAGAHAFVFDGHDFKPARALELPAGTAARTPA